MSVQNLDDIALIPAPLLRRKLGVSEMTVWRWLAAGRFPEPDVVVNRRRFWKVSTVSSWMVANRPGSKAA
jgi:predicted DNA-binding transcriptional regulator AlpA